jgi:hypothetical protein
MKPATSYSSNAKVVRNLFWELAARNVCRKYNCRKMFRKKGEREWIRA